VHICNVDNSGIILANLAPNYNCFVSNISHSKDKLDAKEGYT